MSPLRVGVAFLFVALAVAQEPRALDDERIRSEFAAIAEKARLPALGGAIVTRDGLQGSWVTGVRSSSHDVAVTAADRWHLGSCTKAMTATLVALLVERGDLAWDRKLAELLPDLKLDPGFAEVTLVDVLAHRAGLPTMTGPDPAFDDLDKLPGTPVELRLEVARRVLTQPPASAPRAKLAYSNVGYIVAGHILERLTGKSWEALMQELLFSPLGMATAGFGPPGFDAPAQAITQPWSHHADGKAIAPGPDADNAPFLGPAGTVHASLADWGKFLQLHLRGAQGDVKVGEITLTKATFARLHSAWPGDGMRYGYGWVLQKRDWAAGGTVLMHNGSNTMWYCVCWLDPTAGFGLLATTNIANEGARGAADQAVAFLLKQWLPAPGKDGK